MMIVCLFVLHLFVVVYLLSNCLFVVFFHTHTDMLCEGDELLEVNGVPVMGKTTDEILRLMV